MVEGCCTEIISAPAAEISTAQHSGLALENKDLSSTYIGMPSPFVGAEKSL